MNKEEIKVMIKDGVYSEDGITYMSDKQYNNYINIIEQLQQENQKYQEVIDKAIDYVENGDLLYLASKCSIIYRNNVEVVAICDRLNELLDILKEVE